MGAVKDFRTERVEVSYKRLKADWNKDKDVVGFWSQKVIRFNLLNHGESSKAVEIIEPCLRSRINRRELEMGGRESLSGIDC